jgi:small subunit ribosomal protein S5
VLLKLQKGVELSVSAVVVGDENGVVGHGLGKSKDVSEAIAAVEDAKKNLVKFLWSICSSRTKGKFGGARVF